VKQAVDALREEIDELGALLDSLDARDWERPTPFKGWTPWDVVAHLHWTDRQALLALKDPVAFRAATEGLGKAARQGTSLIEYTRRQLAELDAALLLDHWRREGRELCNRLGEMDPKARLPWYGPDMGARMFTTARQMETWAHGQDVYDLLGRERRYADRIQNIAVIGVKTFAWTYINRGLRVPDVLPHVHLTAPSGALWEYHPPSEVERIEGPASDFCHVVTQGRNVAETQLRVVGEVAAQWMKMAQCFAGPPATPPAPGARTRELRR